MDSYEESKEKDVNGVDEANLQSQLLSEPTTVKSVWKEFEEKS